MLREPLQDRASWQLISCALAFGALLFLAAAIWPRQSGATGLLKWAPFAAIAILHWLAGIWMLNRHGHPPMTTTPAAILSAFTSGTAAAGAIMLASLSNT
ncbi:MAG: hypothetical protein F9K44_07970 [Hyphomicrobiaceae bacterium]|nr:MAG: hypothetical protein F9K44_07970 [Hyphomicrobiaceae bacterium]